MQPTKDSNHHTSALVTRRGFVAALCVSLMVHALLLFFLSQRSGTHKGPREETLWVEWSPQPAVSAVSQHRQVSAKVKPIQNQPATTEVSLIKSKSPDTEEEPVQSTSPLSDQNSSQDQPTPAQVHSSVPSDHHNINTNDQVAPQVAGVVATSSSTVMLLARPLASNPQPVYPRAAQRRGIEGKVLLGVEVSALGLPLNVNVQQSSGHPMLDEAALQAVRQWKFQPARHGSMDVRSQVQIPVVFRLQGRS